MKNWLFSKNIRFYLFFFNLAIATITIIQINVVCFGAEYKVILILSIIVLLIVFVNLYFVFHRFNRELFILQKSIQLLIDNNFSRKFKIHKFPINDEIGLISEEVSIMLEKVHQRSTELYLRRKELNETGRNIAYLSAIGREITTKLDFSEIIRTLFYNVNQLFETSLLAIGIYNTVKNGLDFYGIRTGTNNIMTGFENMKDSDRWSVHCFNTLEEIIQDHYNPVSDKHFSTLLFNDPLDLRESFIYIPLINGNQKIGVITVQCFKTNAYNAYHLGILKNLANYITVAIQNAKAFKQIEVQKKEIETASQNLKKAHDELETKVAMRTHELFLRNKEIEKQNLELEYLSLVARKTDNAIMIMDAVGNIQWVNECFSKIYNYTFEEFIKVRGNNIIQTSFNPNIKTTLQECIQTKKSVYYEALNITGDGKGIWTQTTLTPVLDNSCEISHLLTIDSDITKRKEYEIKITQQSNDITNSIRYAFQIQKALIPPRELFKSYLKDYLIIYKPKAIVSGDFYWIDQRNDQVLIALADCTGHGIPGAFMSILGISLMNEIFKMNKWHCTGNLLNILRNDLKKSLRQNHFSNELSDGMDISLCIVDKRQMKLKFSGANNSLFIARNNELIEIKGDKMPIGIYVNDKSSFNCKEIEIRKDDKFYMSTDGYFDQFGGEKNKKFMIKRFTKLLLEIHLLEFKEQKKILDNTIRNWQGIENEQIDDISIVGFKI
jgi:PAS domain S-box-containing protein